MQLYPTLIAVTQAPTVPHSDTTAWAFFSVLGGSIVGALISALVSFAIQKKNLDAGRRQREDDRLATRRALGYSLLFKMIKLASNIENLGKALESQLQEAKERGLAWRPFQIVQPIVPAGDEIHFDPTEMALILSIDFNLFNEIAALDQLHNSTVALFDLYGRERRRVLERFGATMTGTMGTTSLTQAEHDWLVPRAAELDSLIASMRKRSQEDGKLAWASLLSLRDALEKHLDIKHKLERKAAAA